MFILLLSGMVALVLVSSAVLSSLFSRLSLDDCVFSGSALSRLRLSTEAILLVLVLGDEVLYWSGVVDRSKLSGAVFQKWTRQPVYLLNNE